MGSGSAWHMPADCSETCFMARVAAHACFICSGEQAKDSSMQCICLQRNQHCAPGKIKQPPHHRPVTA